MNKQEAIEKLNGLDRFVKNKSCSMQKTDFVEFEQVIDIINQIDEPQKPKVSQVAVEFYEKYEADNLDLGEWFSDFYSDEAIEDFPRMEELAEWLHGNDRETNRKREFALATLVTLGIDAVEVEKEKLYTVEIPDPYSIYNHTVLAKRDTPSSVVAINRFDSTPNYDWKKDKDYQLTESAIKRNHDWAWQFAVPVEVK